MNISIWPWKKIRELERENIQLQINLAEYERFYKEDVVKMASEAGEKIQAWEDFFSSTLEDVQSVVTLLDNLMKHRQLIADDPDIQNLFKVMVILKDVLVGYINAKNGNIEPVTDSKES